MKNRINKQAVACVSFVLTLIVFYNNKVNAQNPLLIEGMKITEAYRAANYLSFDVKYTYAKESTPSVIEDSSIVHYKMHGNKYQGSMDSVVFMQNDSIQVAAYLEEQIMTLALPANTMSLPMAQWDSFFNKNDFTYSMGADNGYKKIAVDYTNYSQSLIQGFEIWYDPVTYMVSRIKYKVDESTMNKEFVEEDLISGEMMVVDIVFSNYRTDAFSSEVFNAGNYYIKTAGAYSAASSYDGFEVYVVSPGL